MVGNETVMVQPAERPPLKPVAEASRNLHVVERFSLIDDLTLPCQFTVEAPIDWTEPWSGEFI